MKRLTNDLCGLSLLVLGLAGTSYLRGILLYLPIREFWINGAEGFGNKAFYYWLPILLFLPPAVYFVHTGWRVLHDHKVGRLVIIETVLMLTLAGIIVHLNQAADSDYAERSRPISNQSIQDSTSDP